MADQPKPELTYDEAAAILREHGFDPKGKTPEEIGTFIGSCETLVFPNEERLNRLLTGVLLPGNTEA